MIRSYRDLEIWRKSIDLVVDAYRATEHFPRTETFGLSSQLRRSATSISSNIAEGKAIGGLNYPRHLKLAHGSEAELQTQIEIARRLTLLTEAEAAKLLDSAAEIGRMLVGLLRAVPRQ